MNPVEQFFSGRLEERRLADNLRTLKSGRAPVDFYSNDYLGLATSGILEDLMKLQPHRQKFTGSTGSRLLSGNSMEMETLEQTIASFHKAEAALVFNSGYDANVGLLACIASRNTTILSDELCHASLIDGIRLSQCTRKYKFRHNDTTELETLLLKHKNSGPVIVVAESVYSMDGDMAPLGLMVQLCEIHGAQLIIDEAHATGVFGIKGDGLVCANGLQDKVFARVYTYGKALGCHGATVVGSNLLKQYLINFSRPFIYTTALPGHSIQAIGAAYSYLSASGFTNKPLHELVAYFRQCITASGSGTWKDSYSPIQALVIGDNKTSKMLALKLQHSGLQVNPILHPTVPAGMERLRVCLHTHNTTDQVDLLFAVLAGQVQ